MTESSQRSGDREAEGKRPLKSRKSLSMHEGKAVWCDCCSCEAEERWAALADEMGIDLSDDEPENDETER